MTEDVESTAKQVIEVVLRHQRKASGAGACRQLHCGICLFSHLGQVKEFIRAGRPIRLVLPAFPGKSPNEAKVLGPLPDMAEQLALEFLDSLIARIKRIYTPGAEIIICSDGRVFSDVVGIRDEDITAYQVCLQEMLGALPQQGVSFLTLDDIPEMAGHDHERMRELLDEKYSEPLEDVQARVRSGVDVSLYRAITRFLYEDGNTATYTGSKSALQRDARARAYRLMQRSKAWGDLIEHRFPGAIRLSIHPQPCGAKKLGIHLVATADNWLTPWHSVAVAVNGRYVLMKRADAARLDVDLVTREGRPSHFVLRTPATHEVAGTPYLRRGAV